MGKRMSLLHAVSPSAQEKSVVQMMVVGTLARQATAQVPKTCANLVNVHARLTVREKPVVQMMAVAENVKLAVVQTLMQSA